MTFITFQIQKKEITQSTMKMKQEFKISQKRTSKKLLFQGAFKMGGRWGSNPRPSVPQTDALTN